MTNTRPVTIESLISLRFIFAIMIFLHHCSVNGEELFPQGGALSVVFFFVLSGFVLTLNYEKRILNREISHFNFFMKRLIKVYPLHLLCFFVAAFVTHGSIKTAIPNVLLLQSWIPLRGFYFSFNAVAWYLSTLIFGYFMFPFLIQFFNKTGLKKSFLLFAVVVIILFISTFFCPEKYSHRFYYIFPPTRLLDFIAGIFLYYAYRHCKDKLFNINFSKLKISILEFLAVILFVIFAYYENRVPDALNLGIYYWMPALFLIFVLTYFNKSGGVLAHLLTNRLLIYMGNISFTFYMIHQLAISTMNGFFNYFASNMVWQYKFAVIFITTCLLSIFISKFYENPISKFINKKIILK